MVSWQHFSRNSQNNNYLSLFQIVVIVKISILLEACKKTIKNKLMRGNQLLKCSTGIVVPCYNEMNRIQLPKFSEFLISNDFIYFCFVNDGSTDGTQKILVDFVNLNPERSQLVNLSKNQGKAEAVRQGINTLLKSSKFQLVGYWDADLAVPLTEIRGFIKSLKVTMN